MAPTSDKNMETSNIGPCKRKAPVNDNGEAVNIPKKKKPKAAALPVQPWPAAHTSLTLKKQSKSKTHAEMPTHQAPAKKPAAPAVEDSDLEDETKVLEDSDVITIDLDEEPEVLKLEVPLADVKTDEEELGL